MHPHSMRQQGRPAAARITAIATHLPDRVLSNDDLAALYPAWPAAKILEKTGIRERRIAAEGETATDLAFAAADKLFASGAIARDEVDFLILCTQAPDHILPTSACLLQHRLGLPTRMGALDINLGCSGFVYGLSLAAGLIASGAAANVVLLTADTYSKFIHPGDKSVRTLFGDGAAATLIRAGEPGEAAGIGPFVFGTDGSGAGDLIVEAGAARLPRSARTAAETTDRTGNTRSRDHLYMNGGAVLNFTLREVPRAVAALLAKTETAAADYDRFIFHQANKFMLAALERKLGLPPERVSRRFEAIGNTVSSTIPFALEQEMADGACSPGTRMMLVGFGVGLSWAATSVTF
jgi:3-oxoacyl-[acyl-carrier-protein] synthase III